METWKPPTLSFVQEPYQGKAFQHGHPDHLAALAALFGLRAAPPERCRVLELGCGDGWNLIPMVEELPDSEFVGVDLHAARLEPGRRAKEALGLERLEFLARDVADLDEKLGRFDYVIAHGLYSWTSAPVREVFFERVRALLSDRGIAYVSANVYPGWHVIDSARNLALFHAHVKEPSAGEPFLKELRQVARFFSDQMPRDTPPRSLLADQYRGLSGMSDYLVTFDQLTEIAPEYFEPLARRAEQSGLVYVTDAILPGGQTARLPPNLRRGIAELTQDRIQREQYADFCLMPSFRQLVLCPGDQAPVELGVERLRELYVLSNLRRAKSGDPTQRGVVQYEGGGLKLQIEQPALKTALAELAEAFPRALSVRELGERVAARVRSELTPDPVLESALLELVATGVLLPRTRPVTVASEAGERPRISASGRLGLRTLGFATNRHHTIVNLPAGFDREALVRMDGKLTKAQIRDELVGLVERGAILKTELGADVGEVALAVAARLEKTLKEAARIALLLPEP